MAKTRKSWARSSPHRVAPDALRWRCDPKALSFKTTRDLVECPIHIIGQDRAQDALRLGLAVRSDGFNIFVTGEVGSGRSTVVKRLLDELERGEDRQEDLVYVHNFEDPDRPVLLTFPAGRGRAFAQAMEEWLESLVEELPKLFDSEEYRRNRMAMFEAAAQEQKDRLKGFEKKIQEQGFALVQVQLGPVTRPHIVPVVEEKPVDMDELEERAEQGNFPKEEFQRLQASLPELRTEMESLGQQFRKLDRAMRKTLADLDRAMTRPVVEESVAELKARFEDCPVTPHLDRIVEDVLEHLAEFRDAGETAPETDVASVLAAHTDSGAGWRIRYLANPIVDNEKTRGRPIIWESAPNYGNLFGSVERVKTDSGDLSTDHSQIRAGSLLRANGGYLVLDAMDVLVEPGVWPALKRTLRNRKLVIQSYDPLHVLSGVVLKPEPIPLDVKVVMIGTRHIYRVLYGMDEDFKKIFKIKSEFAMSTPLSDEETRNYACLVYKKVQDEGLPHFHADAVAAIVEQGVRLSGHNAKLTTRFGEVADLIRESGFWARNDRSTLVRTRHVKRAIAGRTQRVDLIEEMLRERIGEGMVLLDLDGVAVGQVNGLAVLDTGDHQFGQPSRITATTAVGRAGVIDLDREADMSGSTHTKGVLILTGFLRSMFAQERPLALTATLSFEQNYGGVDGDSASSTELYALLSSLSGVPIRQGVAVTGSVNQRGEIQPIGGVNEKIEGFFGICRLAGLNGSQGVMIPRRNLPHLMLRDDVVREVRRGRFHVWAVDTVSAGLEVLTGVAAGARQESGDFPEGSVFARADARLRDLAEQVRRHGRADVPS